MAALGGEGDREAKLVACEKKEGTVLSGKKNVHMLKLARG